MANQRRPTPDFSCLTLDQPDAPSSEATANTNSNNYVIGQRCHYPGCLEVPEFKQESAFKKHMDKHLRPYKCSSPACKAGGFARPGDLKRHEREVHTTPIYTCPIATCKRRRRRFSRKDNLVQHMRRTHDQRSDDMTTQPPDHPSAQSLQTFNNDFASDGAVANQGPATGNNKTTSAGLLVASLPNSPDKYSLMAKLQELELEKEKAVAKFDGDIEAVKRVLSFT
ncbi:hypothetical protein BDZ45DRAFT_799415 [Acephala macrosclerotiorum]|nr:hypothetical protein BDZ45DRAFT_799415 [Acephala macrosclerotiorum]